MKKLLIYLKGYEKETVLAPLFKMLEALFELFVPLVMAAVIDVGIGRKRQGLYCENVPHSRCPGCDRPDLLYYGPVLCSKGGDRIFHSIEKRAVRTYPEPLIIRRWTRSVPLH